MKISIWGPGQRFFHAWTTKAFDSIELVSRLMSFHDPESELSRLNNSEVGKWISLDKKLIEVLKLALEIQKKSSGYYNVAIAKPLMHWKFLPGQVKGAPLENLSAFGFEVRGREARLILPVKIDLGGIAKGYAVDLAVETLQRHSKKISGCVNAGGDLRVFGKDRQIVWMRCLTSTKKIYLGPVGSQALATSEVIPRLGISPYVDTRRGLCLKVKKTVVARAKRCVIADAFTKIGLLMPLASAKILAEKFNVKVNVIT